MDPKREEKHRIRANVGQKRVGGGVNREQKQRATEEWEKPWGSVQVPPSCGKNCKTLRNSRAKRLGPPGKEGRRHKGKGTHRGQSSESPETRDGPIGVWRREKGTIGYEEGDKKNQDRQEETRRGRRKQCFSRSHRPRITGNDKKGKDLQKEERHTGGEEK
ncbi:hypothetical protein NPIL_355741 [Nephila pilipes]|uniref:Uncharacterized protein n=1 Tax=Nephila pilipes TaxID=299642 RepID=A0A8X6Q4B6_NEPPI|nr:hypothetical protein NPIL_355741 [Nephila pilipes]